MYPFDSNVCTIDMEGKTYAKWNSYNFLKYKIVYNLQTLNLGLNISRYFTLISVSGITKEYVTLAIDSLFGGSGAEYTG